jgi:ParB family transcriptional regulator, chromosome partitioning protein
MHALTEGQIPGHDRRALFIGIEAYEAAGGTVIRDLFDEGGGFFGDAALLNRLVRDKLQRMAETVMAEGWKWVTVEPEFDNEKAATLPTIETQPKPLSAEEQAALDELQQQLEALWEASEGEGEAGDEVFAEIDRLEDQIATLSENVFLPEDISRAGAFVTLGRDGAVRIERGYLRPEDAGADESTPHKSKRPSDEDSGPRLSAALVAELTAHRTVGLRNDLAQQPELALIAITHALVGRLYYPSQNLSCLDLRASTDALSRETADSQASREIAARHEAWAARLPNEGELLWTFIASLTMDDLMALLAHASSLSLDAVQQPGSFGETGKLRHAAILAAAMPHKMSRYWQPSVGNYLGRVDKDSIAEAVREAAGEDAARRIAGLKKHAMAQEAERLLAGKEWLPALLRPAEPQQAPAQN